jgi:methionyl-tRNA formyltransferase
VVQDELTVTLAPKIDRTLARIDWSQTAERLAHHVAAFDPIPGAWTTLGGADVKVFKAGKAGKAGRAGRAGEVVRADDELEIATGEGSLLIREVQPAGKKRQPVADWVRGRGIAAGATFE